MRPVDKGPCPKDKNGDPVMFKEYQEAREYLIDRVGSFCSYCEISHPAPDTEHVLPKSLRGSLKLSWSNFLLACTNCNSVKGKKKVRLRGCFWPDRDNTARAFVYSTHGKVELAQGLTPRQKSLALKTMELTGFYRDMHTNPPATERDRRWKRRSEAWIVAERTKVLLAKTDSEEMRELAVMTAVGHGNWSVWMSVFADDGDMQRRLIAGFKGTAKTCWNGVLAKRRPGGQL